MNVAITRAKELLIVVGSADLLGKSDPYWKGFLQFALRHNLSVFLSFDFLFLNSDMGLRLC
jgi:superfamily I DNA and/or RNA helicase